MTYMFYCCTNFNRGLKWDMSKVKYAMNMFTALHCRLV